MIPNFFSKKPIPRLPAGMQATVNKLKKSGSKEKCLRNAYDILTSKYKGYPFRTYTRFWQVFETDLDKLWEKNDFIHCTNMNYLLRVLLIKSGYFSEDDIKLKRTLVWYLSPHQYLRVRIHDKKFVNIDIWGHANGIKFGDYARGFFKS